MKKAAIVVMVIMGMAGMSHGADVSASVDLASAYVFRGVTFNDGAVLQPGLEARGLPFTVGVWGNLDLADYDALLLEDGQFTELDLFASYDLPLSIDPLGLSVGYTEYTYPSGGGDADREVMLSLSLDVPLSPSLAVNYGIDGGIEESLYVELAIEHEHTFSDTSSVSASAAIGYADPDGGEGGFSHFTVGLGATWRCVSTSVTYIGQIDDEVLPDVDETLGTAGYDADVVVTVGLSQDF